MQIVRKDGRVFVLVAAIGTDSTKFLGVILHNGQVLSKTGADFDTADEALDAAYFLQKSL